MEMTLREKFEDGFKDPKENAKYCEQIADDYAIEFAEWIIKGRIDKELLEIFKKEKEL